MKTLFIGDLHGCWEIAQAAAMSNYPDRVVFMGDYLDSFHRSVEDQVHTLNLVLNLCESNPEKYIGLLGNHELSYIDDRMRCSGYNSVTQFHVTHMKDRMLKILKAFTWEQGWLASHAGVSQYLLDRFGESLESYLESGNIHHIGRYRGGCDRVGGLLWCDWNNEFEPIEGVNQVVGHTHYRTDDFLKTVEGKNSINYNVDCNRYGLTENYKDSMFLVIKDGVPITVSFDYLF